MLNERLTAIWATPAVSNDAMLSVPIRHVNFAELTDGPGVSQAGLVIHRAASGQVRGPADLGSSAWRGDQMIRDEGEDSRIYSVVCNREGQYSIWPNHKAVPRGWQSVGKEGLKAECLRYIESVWTDMRPLSLRGLAEQIFSEKNSSL